jgi:hypothetical protein
MSGGLALIGAGGFLPEMVKGVLERGLQSGLTGRRPAVPRQLQYSCAIESCPRPRLRRTYPKSVFDCL